MPRHFDDILLNAFLWGGVVTCVLGLIGAGFAGTDAVRRIDAVTLATQRIVSGALSQRLPVHGRSGDLDRLIHVINGMLDEIERLMQEVKRRLRQYCARPPDTAHPSACRARASASPREVTRGVRGRGG